jgi:hypothetical protein
MGRSWSCDMIPIFFIFPILRHRCTFNDRARIRLVSNRLLVKVMFVGGPPGWMLHDDSQELIVKIFWQIDIFWLITREEQLKNTIGSKSLMLLMLILWRNRGLDWIRFVIRIIHLVYVRDVVNALIIILTIIQGALRLVRNIFMAIERRRIFRTEILLFLRFLLQSLRGSPLLGMVIIFFILRLRSSFGINRLLRVLDRGVSHQSFYLLINIELLVV